MTTSVKEYIVTDEDVRRGYMIVPEGFNGAGYHLPIRAVKGDVIKLPQVDREEE